MSSEDLLLAVATATQASPVSAEAVASGADLTVPILMFFGVLFILLETLVPGGVLGIFGGFLVICSVVIATQTHGGAAGLVTLAVGFLSSLIAIGVGWHFLPKTNLGKKLFLTPSFGPAVPPATAEGRAKSTVKAGDQGVSLSDLRPSGLAQVGEWRIDVVTRGEYIEQGTPIEVVGRDGTRVVVRARPPSAAPET